MTCGDSGAGLVGGESVFCVSAGVKKGYFTSEESRYREWCCGVISEEMREI